SEIDLTMGDQRIRLRRGSRVVSAAPVAFPPPAVTPPPQPTPAPIPPPTKENPGRPPAEITEETPGPFYPKPEPDKPPFVTKGSRVKPETVVGLIEAMKLFTEIPAGVAGVIEEILAENGQAVEYGQVLFRVDPAG